MKKVLIALAYDPSAQKVAEAGFLLAKTMEAEIILMHVIIDSTFYSVLEYAQIVGFMGFNNNEAFHLFDNGLKKAMNQYLEKSKQHLGDENIQTLVKEEDDFAESIIDAAKDMQADIIVMGSHSMSMFENIVIGSVTEKVLRFTTTTLFIVPTKNTIKVDINSYTEKYKGLTTSQAKGKVRNESITNFLFSKPKYFYLLLLELLRSL